MHELSLVENIFEQLDEMLERYQLKEISDVHVVVGELSGVDHRFLLSAFEMAKEQTPWAHLKLHIEKQEWKIRCQSCEGQSAVDKVDPRCSFCGSESIETIQGTDFLIQRIEGVAIESTNGRSQ